MAQVNDNGSEQRRPAQRAWTWKDREAASRPRGVYLDPDLQPPGGEKVYPTAYEPDVLLVGPVDGDDAPGRVKRLDELAARLGWTVTEEALVDSAPRESDRSARRLPSVAQTIRARIAVSPSIEVGQPIGVPDAWRLLQEARRAGIPGVALNHVLSVDEIGTNPFKGNPFKGNPFKGNPFKGNPFKGNPGGIDSYAYPGFGGRQPVYYTGPTLPRSPDADLAGRRPIVAVLDTGIGIHPWFGPGVVVDAVSELGGTIGVVDPRSDPERHPSLGDPLDGVFDDAAGHGTFIAGIVLQECPEARILPVRIADGQGIILENELLDTLGQLLGVVGGGFAIDVVNLSFSYYHESPDSASAIDGELYLLLAGLRADGTVVVCSAGNDATDRPASPAALYDWAGSTFGIAPGSEAGLAPQVAVGALNPSAHTVALFSNIGPWVHTYARGVSVLSAVPVSFQGGAQPDLRFNLEHHRRSTLDVDDFRAGYAVWSGTSFAAPLVAGRIAQALLDAPLVGKGILPPQTVHGLVDIVVGEVDAEDRSREP